jgi:hypothetical protein
MKCALLDLGAPLDSSAPSKFEHTLHWRQRVVVDFFVFLFSKCKKSQKNCNFAKNLKKKKKTKNTNLSQVRQKNLLWRNNCALIPSQSVTLGFCAICLVSTFSTWQPSFSRVRITLRQLVVDVSETLHFSFGNVTVFLC